MGEAKRRGTYEERKAAAIERKRSALCSSEKREEKPLRSVEEVLALYGAPRSQAKLNL